MKNQARMFIGVLAMLLFLFTTPATALDGKLTAALVPWGNGQLDPHQVTTGIEILNTGLVMFNGLLQRGPDGAIQPVLATDWEMSPDGLSYTFNLRKDVKFQNGDAFTAEDVKFSYDRVLSDEVRSIRKPVIAKYLDRIEVIDPYKVKLYLKKPYPEIVERVGDYMLIMPKGYYEKVGKKGFEAAPIGAGPWKFVKRNGNDAIFYTANESYFGEGPYIKELVTRNIPEEATKWAAIKNGEIDAAYFTALPYLKEAKFSSEFKVLAVRHAIMETLWPRLDKPVDELDAQTKPLADAQVRRAVTMAIDREALIASVTYGYGSVMKYNICPNERGFRQEDQPVPYDPEGAKRLLAEAGYPNGFKTTINSSTFELPRLTALFVQAQLAEVGIQVHLELMDQGTLNRRGFATKDLSGFNTASWLSATHFEPWGWAGLARPFQGPAWDRLKGLYTQATSAYKIEDRQRIADEIRELQIKELPVIPLAVLDQPWVVRSRVAEWPNYLTFPHIATANLAKLKK